MFLLELFFGKRRYIRRRWIVRALAHQDATPRRWACCRELVDIRLLTRLERRRRGNDCASPRLRRLHPGFLEWQVGPNVSMHRTLEFAEQAAF